MKNGVEDFVVESTPVLDLKKHGLPPQGGSNDVQWDSDRTEVYSDADGDTSVASLIGDQGEVYPITTFPFVIGRGAECDLVLQGKGISRRHAEIIFQAGRFVVNDLDSLNGIKVNGYKVSRVILEENDAIRLGEIALAFRSRSPDAAKEEASTKEKTPRKSLFSTRKDTAAAQVKEDHTFGPSPLKKIATQSAVAVVLVLAAFAGYQYWQNNYATQGKIVQLPAAVTPPSPQQPPADQAKVDNQVGETQPAEPAVDAVDPPPSLAPPPSIAVAEPEALTPLKPVAPVAAKPTPKVAPKPVQPVATAKPAAAPAAATEQVRRDLARSEDLYFKGDAQAAINLLKPALENTRLPPALRTQIRTTYTNLTTLYNQYGSGQSAYANGDKEGAFQTWNAFMAKESSLFGGRKSTYTRTISSRVVGEYVSLGNDAARAGDHHKAYRMWQKALELGDNVAARIALENANNKGMQLYRQALRLEYVNAGKAKALWQEVTQLLPPGTEYHTKASAKLAWYDKWGA